MCHDPAKAEKFYVALPDKAQDFETRRLRLKALKLALDKSKAGEESTDESSSLAPDESAETPSSSSGANLAANEL